MTKFQLSGTIVHCFVRYNFAIISHKDNVSIQVVFFIEILNVLQTIVSNPKLASSSIVDVDIPGIKVSQIGIGPSFVFMWNCYRAKILGKSVQTTTTSCFLSRPNRRIRIN